MAYLRMYGGGIPTSQREVYAFKIDKTDSNFATAVTAYASEWGCDNMGFTPAYMDYTNDAFNYGSWTGNEFFWPKPCILGYDGNVIAYLNPNNYEKDVNGNNANITSPSGNVMIEFPTVYMKRWESGNYAYVVISNEKINNDFVAYAHHDINGNVLDNIYFSAYDGSFDGTRMRSISGKTFRKSPKNPEAGYMMKFCTHSQEASYAAANNANNEHGEGWYIWHFADVDLVRMLLILIGMSLDSQTTFGCGNANGFTGETIDAGVLATGSMNNKGLFWGSNQESASGVKVFGIENFWGNTFKHVAGHCLDNGTQKFKITYGTEDGSTDNGFNFTGSGYLTISGTTPTGESGFAKGFKMTSKGMVLYETGGSESTYLCDRFAYNTSGLRLSGVSGHNSMSGGAIGAFYSSLADEPSYTGDRNMASLTYKAIV